jgi:dsDNA-binding SOS-regulon protein
MAVESRFVVIRHGVEAKTFMDKKSADDYDKMLDMADNLADVLAKSPIELNDTASEELSIYLAQNRDDVLIALLAKKPPQKAPVKKATKKAVESQAEKVTTK